MHHHIASWWKQNWPIASTKKEKEKKDTNTTWINSCTSQIQLYTFPSSASWECKQIQKTARHTFMRQCCLSGCLVLPINYSAKVNVTTILFMSAFPYCLTLQLAAEGKWVLGLQYLHRFFCLLILLFFLSFLLLWWWYVVCACACNVYVCVCAYVCAFACCICDYMPVVRACPCVDACMCAYIYIIIDAS